MKDEPLAEIVQLPPSARAIREEQAAAFWPGLLALLMLWAWVWRTIMSASDIDLLGKLPAAWSTVKTRWSAEREAEAQKLTAAQASAAVTASPGFELSDELRNTLQEIVSLAE